MMPFYDYRCPECGHEFEAHHSMSAAAPACPACTYTTPTRLITGTPAVTGGVATPAGSTRGATKEQIRAKWAEETPQLRKKLVSKLGEDFVSRNAPQLNPKND